MSSTSQPALEHEEPEAIKSLLEYATERAMGAKTEHPVDAVGYLAQSVLAVIDAMKMACAAPTVQLNKTGGDGAVREHEWRTTRAGEPREEGAVCEKCGAYANSGGDKACMDGALACIRHPEGPVGKREPVVFKVYHFEQALEMMEKQFMFMQPMGKQYAFRKYSGGGWLKKTEDSTTVISTDKMTFDEADKERFWIVVSA